MLKLEWRTSTGLFQALRRPVRLNVSYVNHHGGSKRSARPFANVSRVTKRLRRNSACEGALRRASRGPIYVASKKRLTSEVMRTSFGAFEKRLKTVVKAGREATLHDTLLRDAALPARDCVT